ncbi:MAG: ATPase protein, partial [Elusimicrobia bacterium]
MCRPSVRPSSRSCKIEVLVLKCRTVIERRAALVLRRMLKRFPAVTILGPRQCGKTTFIRSELPDWTYLDLEKPSHHAPLAEDPEARISQT